MEGRSYKSLSKSEVFRRSADVSCHNSMQIHQVICHCASIRDILYNKIVGMKNNQRPLNAATGQSLTGHDLSYFFFQIGKRLYLLQP